MLVDPYDKVRDQLIIPQINVSKDELPEDDLEYITNSLDQNLKFSYILDVKDNLIELTNDIETSSYTDFPSLLHQYRDLVTGIMNFFRSTDSSSMTNEIIHTGDPTFLDILYDTYEAIRNPASALQTGWQALNSALGPRGGFQNKNLYCIHANTNSFKSAMLLHISRMIKEYNAARVIEEFKRTGKIPTVLHISMENDNDEDNERLYKTVVKKDLGKCTSREELNQSWEHNFGSENEENPIDISFLHVDARSLSVDEIDVIIENLEEEGYRVIACVVDYLGLIKPRMEDMGKENRLQLKNIADDLLSLAKNRDIPVITAHQINRSGGAVLTNLKNQGGVNAISQMTNEFIGESYGIEQAVSWSAFIDIEIHGEDRWLMFKRNKSRYKNKFGTETFVMKIRDGIIIDDDIYLSTPLSLPKIPDGIGAEGENATQMQGARGIIDIRDNKHKTPPKDHLIKVKSSTEEREDFLNSEEKIPIEYIDWNNWIDYLDSGNYETDDFYQWSETEYSEDDRSFIIGETEYVSGDVRDELAYVA